MTVLLDNGTTGECGKGHEVGDFVIVDLVDENGMPIQDEGKIVEVLEDCRGK